MEAGGVQDHQPSDALRVPRGVEHTDHPAPVVTEPRSSARADVSRSGTVATLPRYLYVEKSWSCDSPSICRIVSRCPEPTWWQITLSICSFIQPSLVRNADQVRTPRATPCFSTETESVDMNCVNWRKAGETSASIPQRQRR